MDRKISLLKLFFIFFKIGMVLFGGGYAILPFLKAEMVEKEKICTMEEITDFYAISQCFPGLVAGNVSMLAGYKARGIRGALVAVLGVCLPAFISIVLIFAFLNIVMHYSLIKNIFYALDVAVCVLIILTVIELWGFSVKDKFSFFIFVVALTASIFKVSPFLVVITAGLLGIFRHFVLKQCNCCEEGEIDE